MHDQVVSNFLPADEAVSFLGITRKSLSIQICRKRKLGLGHLFKKDGRYVLVDVTHFRDHDHKNYAPAAEIEKIELLYFKAVELYGNDFRLAKFIGPIIGVNVHTAYKRLRYFRFKTKRVAGEMRMALQAAIEKRKKV